MSVLRAAARKRLKKSQFADPGSLSKTRGSGGCPIPDIEHGRKALQLCAGRPGVKAKVCRKFPSIGSCK